MDNQEFIRIEVMEFIRQFKDKKSICNDSGEIIDKIIELNPYEYLYFINEILLDIDINIDNLKQIFSFNYWDGHEIVIDANGADVIRSISLRQAFFSIEDFESIFKDYDISTRILKLILFKNKFLDSCAILKDKIIEKLRFLRTIFDIKILSQEICEMSEYYTDDKGFFRQDIIYSAVKKSVFDKIVSDISSEFENFLSRTCKYEIDNRLRQECKRAKILIDYEKVIDYKDQVIFPLLYHIDDWKAFVANDLISNEQNFEKRKLFHIECLNEFNYRTNQNYIRQLIYEEQIDEKIIDGRKILIHWSPDAFSIDKLKFWISDTFGSYRKIKDFDLISIIDELPTKSKIVLSPNFSQPAMLDILVKFFNESNVKIDSIKMNALKGFVSNFFVLPEPAHHKKYIDKMPYQKIDFIPQKFYKDFIRIFLILYNPRNAVVISNITTIRKLLTALFYDENLSQGLSYESIRRIKNLKFSKEMNSFKSYLRYVLSGLNRDYFLP